MPDEKIKPVGTVIAFDFGLRRIGVAVGQTLTGSASALAVVPFANKPPQTKQAGRHWTEVTTGW